jgi:hypothetical protein
MKKLLIDLDFLVSDLYFYATSKDRLENKYYNNALKFLNSTPIESMWYWLNFNQSKYLYTGITSMSKTPQMNGVIGSWIDQWEIPIDSVIFSSEKCDALDFDIALYAFDNANYDHTSESTDIYFVRMPSNVTEAFDFFKSDFIQNVETLGDSSEHR